MSAARKITPADIAKLKAALPTMDEAQKRKTAALLVDWYKKTNTNRAKDDFI